MKYFFAALFAISAFSSVEAMVPTTCIEHLQSEVSRDGGGDFPVSNYADLIQSMRDRRGDNWDFDHRISWEGVLSLPFIDDIIISEAIHWGPDLDFKLFNENRFALRNGFVEYYERPESIFLNFLDTPEIDKELYSCSYYQKVPGQRPLSEITTEDIRGQGLQKDLEIYQRKLRSGKSYWVFKDKVDIVGDANEVLFTFVATTVYPVRNSNFLEVTRFFGELEAKIKAFIEDRENFQASYRRSYGYWLQSSMHDVGDQAVPYFARFSGYDQYEWQPAVTDYTYVSQNAQSMVNAKCMADMDYLKHDKAIRNVLSGIRVERPGEYDWQADFGALSEQVNMRHQAFLNCTKGLVNSYECSKQEVKDGLTAERKKYNRTKKALEKRVADGRMTREAFVQWVANEEGNFFEERKEALEDCVQTSLKSSARTEKVLIETAEKEAVETALSGTSKPVMPTLKEVDTTTYRYYWIALGLLFTGIISFLIFLRLRRRS